MPKLDSIKLTDNCITIDEKEDFGLLNGNNYEIFIPKDWTFAKLDSALPKDTFVFSTNPNDDYQFFSVWSGDYNKTAKDLLLESITSLTNYNIVDQKSIINEKGIEFKHMTIELKNGNTEFIQDTYAYVQNNKAYLLLLRSNSLNETNSQILKKIICSFKLTN
jgi:hypothetical protein